MGEPASLGSSTSSVCWLRRLSSCRAVSAPAENDRQGIRQHTTYRGKFMSQSVITVSVVAPSDCRVRPPGTRSAGAVQLVSMPPDSHSYRRLLRRASAMCRWT